MTGGCCLLAFLAKVFFHQIGTGTLSPEAFICFRGGGGGVNFFVGISISLQVTLYSPYGLQE